MHWIHKIALFLWAAGLYIRLRGVPPELRTAALVHVGFCPKCRAKLRFGDEGILIGGPRGGLARNVYCPTCQNGWNYTPDTPPGFMPVQDIGPVDPDLIYSWMMRIKDDAPLG